MTLYPRIPDQQSRQCRLLLFIMGLLVGLMCPVSWADVPSYQSRISVSLTADEQRWLETHQQVRVGAGLDWAPFDFINEQGQYQGVTRDHLDLIADKTGLKFSYQTGYWWQNLERFRRGQVDLLPAVYKTPARLKFMQFSRAYHETLDYFFIRDDLNPDSLQTLAGLRVAVPKDDAHIQLIETHFPELELVEVDTLGNAIDAVLEGRADLLFETYAVMVYALDKQAITTIQPWRSTRELGSRYIHMATRKTDPILASIIQKGLDAITISEKRVIHERWFKQRSTNVSPGLTLSQSDKDWLAANPSIRFGGDPNWLPYEAFDSDGNYIGIVAEHLKLIAQKLGLDIIYVPTESWSETVAMARNGSIDVLSETSDSELTEDLVFTQSYLSSPVVVVMSNRENYVDSIDQIRDQNIAVIRDYGYVPAISEAYPDIAFTQVASIQDGLTAVSTGRVDALLATLAQASYHISEMGINNIRIVGQTGFYTKLAFGIQPDKAHLVSLFNRALADISQAEKQVILDAWGKHKFVSRVDYGLIIRILLVFLLLAVVILYWNRKLAKEVRLRKEAEAQTQTLLDYIPLQVAVTGYDGKIFTVNPQALRDYKLSAEELHKFNMLDFYQDKSQRDALMTEIREKGYVEQKIVAFRGLDGQVRSMMVSMIPIQYQKQNALLSIAVDITQRLEMEQALREARDKAEVANQAKSAFLANMSHEIRTPMNAIMGFTELLSARLTEPGLKKYADTIKSAGKDLLLLINDILDLSKIEAGKLDIDKSPANAHSLFQEVANIFALSLKQKGVDMLLEVEPGIPESLMLDTVRLRQVLLNLMGNAVKFTESGYVKLRAYTEEEDSVHSCLNLKIDVEDTGIGIAEADLDTIFDEFNQTSSHDLSRFGGTGLGLAISSRLVRLMGGELTVTSQPGVGSTFTVTLNQVDVASIAADETDEQTQSGDLSLQFQPATIMVVDDVANNRQLLRENFRDSTIRVIEASNGLNAIELLETEPVDLILMDLRMPVMSGYEAAARIKAERDIPIIALTASVMREDFERIKKSDFDDYVRKPVKHSALLAALARFLPHQLTESIAVPEAELSLSDAERASLSTMLQRLDDDAATWEQIKSGNNIGAIQRFAEQLLEAGESLQFRPVIDYAQALLQKLEIFDINGINHQLAAYPDLQQQLRSALANESD